MNDATDRRMAALLHAWHAYEATVDDPDPVARHDAHLAFHRAIWSASENVLLEQLWPVIEAHMTIALAEDQRARPNPERSAGSTQHWSTASWLAMSTESKPLSRRTRCPLPRS